MALHFENILQWIKKYILLVRYRHQISASHIAVFADIKKKHSAHAVTADVSIAETAAAAKFFNVDGVIVTGSATGKYGGQLQSSKIIQFKDKAHKQGWQHKY